MRNIYGAAERVLIWLGCRDEKIEQLFNFINTQGEDWRNPYRRFKDEWIWISNQSTVISTIANLPYWKRVWVVQEIMHSPDGLFIYGNSAVRYNRFISFWEDVMSRIAKTLATDGSMHNYRLFRGDTSAVDNFKRITPGSALAGRFIDLPTWLREFSRFKCSDPRDIIFGFLGCFEFSVTESIPVDYAMSVQDLYTRMARLLIEATGNLEVLSVATTREQPSKGLPLTQAPSWVPNFAGKISAAVEERLPDELWHDHCPMDPHFFNLKETEGFFLHLRGITIGKVHQITPSDPFGDLDIDQGSFFDLQAGFCTRIWRIRRELEMSRTDLPRFINAISSWAEQFASCGDIVRDFLEESKEPDLAIHYAFKSWLSVFRFTTRRMFSFKLSNQTNSIEKPTSIFFGRCSIGMKPGDVLCWIFASQFLLALREVDDHYILVGSPDTAGLLTAEFLARMFEEPAEDFFVH